MSRLAELAASRGALRGGNGRAAPPAKRAIAKEVTRAHSETTGANTFFAQVIFNNAQPDDWYMGGAPLEGRQIFVSGQIRGGRTPALKGKLLLALRDAIVSQSGVGNHEMWVYLTELPPANMIENGHVLPEAGQEAAWLAALPAEDRARLEALGR